MFSRVKERKSSVEAPSAKITHMELRSRKGKKGKPGGEVQRNDGINIEVKQSYN